MSEENLLPSPSEAAQRFRPKIYTTVPTIYDWQIKNMAWASYHDEYGGKYRIASPFESYIYAFTGPRGAGKDESLTLLSIIFMAQGLPVWSNYPIKFYYKRYGDGKAALLESQMIDMDKLLNHSEEYQGGLIAISEFQDWDSAYRQMTTQSLILHSWIDQIRKADCSFAYTTKRLKDIGGKTESETDFEICCSDISEIDAGDEDTHPKQRGAMILWNPIIDISGYLTRRMFSRLSPKKQPMYLLWGSFDTKYRFDFFEAMRGVKLDLGKRIIGDGDNGNGGFDLEASKQKLLEVMQSDHIKLTATDVMETVGLNRKQWQIFKQYLSDWGIDSKVSNGQRVYYPSNELVVV